jgi:hypothetical protein
MNQVSRNASPDASLARVHRAAEIFLSLIFLSVLSSPNRVESAPMCDICGLPALPSESHARCEKKRKGPDRKITDRKVAQIRLGPTGHVNDPGGFVESFHPTDSFDNDVVDYRIFAFLVNGSARQG